MTIVYQDDQLLVCLKPAGVLSTDEPGGLPELLRRELGDERADVRTVHRLDRVVGGLMVLARSPESASELSHQIREERFEKEYLAVVHGDPGESGRWRDLMFRDKARKMSFVTEIPGGRTHQIRCQFAAHGFPLAGERKYSTREDPWPLALWSCRLAFVHPESGKRMEFAHFPPETEPWLFFNNLKTVNLFS